jgi:hypothetical protein
MLTIAKIIIVILENLNKTGRKQTITQIRKAGIITRK